MNGFLRCFTMGCGFFIAGMSYASDAAEVSSLLEVYQEAMASDPRLIRAESEAAVFQARERYQFGGLLPQMSIGAQGTRTQRNQPGGMSSADTEYYNGERYYASLTQPLYNKSQWEAFRGAKKEAASYVSQYEEMRSLIALDVVDRYTQVLAAQDNYAFVKAEREAIEEQLGLIRARYERKLAKVTDLLAVEARVNTLYADEIQAKNTLSIAREGLSELLGRAVEEPLAPLEESITVAWDLGLLSDWLGKSLEHNSSLQASRQSLEAAVAAVKQAAGARHPSLSMSLSAQKSDIGFENAQVPESEVYVAALNLTIPIYSGGQVSAQVSEAKARLRIAEQDYEEAQRNLRKRTRESYLNASSARQRVNATERAVVSAQASYAAQQKGFEYGTVTAVDVLDAGQSLYEAKRDFHRAYYDLMLHWLGLQQVSGQFTPDHIVELNDWLNVAAAH